MVVPSRVSRPSCSRGVPGQPKVGQLEQRLAVFLGEQKIRRLDVAMDQVLAVSVGQGLGGLLEQLAGQFDVKFAVAVDIFVQVDAVDELQGQVIGACRLAEFIEGDDILVAQLGDRLGFALEAFAHPGIGGQVGRKDLERHFALGFHVEGFIDRSHAAAGHMAQHFIFAESLRLSPALSCRLRAHASLGTVKPPALESCPDDFSNFLSFLQASNCIRALFRVLLCDCRLVK